MKLLPRLDCLVAPRPQHGAILNRTVLPQRANQGHVDIPIWNLGAATAFLMVSAFPSLATPSSSPQALPTFSCRALSPPPGSGCLAVGSELQTQCLTQGRLQHTSPQALTEAVTEVASHTMKADWATVSLQDR